MVALYFMHLRFEAKTLGLHRRHARGDRALLVMVLLPDSLHAPHQTADSKKLEAPQH